MVRIKSLLEQNAFGVCTYIGERLGIAKSSIRLFFIYTSFMTMGSPLIIYFILAFFMNMHKHLRNQRNSVWDL